MDTTCDRHNMRKGAIVLCGGKSSRMGCDKATLPFGSEVMLQRVVRLMAEVVEPENTIVVAAPGQELPAFPAAIRIAPDELAHQGPLAGLATGLRTIGDRIDAVYATGCDVPLLVPAFVDRLFDLLGEFDIAVPFDGQHHHSLASVYRRSVLPCVEKLLSAERLRPRFLFNEVRTREVPVDDLRVVDPDLLTLMNLNHQQDYESALARAGFTPFAKATGNESQGRAK